MAEVNPPFFEENCYTLARWRKMMNSIVCEEGVRDLSDGDLLVTAVGGGSLNVSVAAGHAWVQADLNGGEGIYEIENDAAEVQTIAANAAGSARIDLVIASIYDSDYVGASDTWSIDIVQGVAGAGVPAVPASTRVGYLLLAQVTVPASGGTPSVVADVRPQMVVCGGPEWQLYTPVGSGFTHDPGNLIGRYVQNGTTVTAVILGQVNTVTGDMLVSRPVPPAALPWDTAIGSAVARDVPGFNRYGSQVLDIQATGSTDSVVFLHSTTPSVWNATLPFVWGAGDQFGGTFTYEAEM